MMSRMPDGDALGLAATVPTQTTDGRFRQRVRRLRQTLEHRPLTARRASGSCTSARPRGHALPTAQEVYRRGVVRSRRTALHPTGGVGQPSDRPALWAGNLRADVFAFHGHAAKGIILNGNGDGYCAFRFSQRCGCCFTRTSLFLNPETLRAEPLQANGMLTDDACVGASSQPPRAPPTTPPRATPSTSLGRSHHSRGTR
jgi:hypothetical protein